MSNEQPTEESELQPIPEEWQDISLDEIVEADYGVAPSPDEENDRTEQMTQSYGIGMYPSPGRVRNDDSIDASSEDPRGTDQGYIFTGYATEAATRIGGEDAGQDEQIARFRELNEGRHQSDGNHSVREHRRDKDRLIESICSSLPLASLEREKVNSVVNQLDMEQFGYQKGIPRVVLGTVAVVIDEQHRDLDNFEDQVSQSDAFESARESLDISMSDLNTIKEIVRDQIDDDVQIPHGPKIPRRDPSLPTTFEESYDWKRVEKKTGKPTNWSSGAQGRSIEEELEDLEEAVDDVLNQNNNSEEDYSSKDTEQEPETSVKQEAESHRNSIEVELGQETEQEAEKLMDEMTEELDEETSE